MTKTGFAKVAIMMAVLYELLLIFLIFLRPDLPVYSTTISEWAIGRFGWLMQGAFFISALAYLFLGLALTHEIKGFWGKTGMVLLFVCFLGTTGAGIFVSNPYPPDLTLTNTLIHTISGTLAMLLLPISAMLIGFNLERNTVEWTKNRKALKLIGLLPLLAFVGFIVHLSLYVIPLGEKAVGPNVPIGYPPRVLFFSYHLWLILLASRFIQMQQSK